MNKSLERKLEDLRKRIRRLDSALVAFSGGVDSSFLLRICREELGEKAVAVTALPNQYPKSELILARRIAKVLGVKHIAYDPSEDVSDDSNIYSSLKSLAMRMRIKNVLDGSHKDDEKDAGRSYQAARKAGVISPLLESNLTKAEIHLLSKKLGLNQDKASAGPKLTKAKKYLERIGAKKATVSCKDRNIYIASHKTDLMKILKKMDRVRKKMRSLGYEEVFVQLS